MKRLLNVKRENWKIGIIHFIIGIFMFVGGYVDNNITLMIVGVLFLLTGIAITSIKYIPMEHGARKLMDIGILIIGIAITIHGYLSTRSLLLMIMLILLVILPIIMFILTKYTKY
ncbi:MAG: hypothetical protein QXD79_06995 [Candidatus Methanomethylicia archaeon]